MLWNCGKIHIFQNDRNQNYVNKEIKSTLNLANTCFYTVQNILPSHHLSKTIKVKIQVSILKW